MKEFINEIKLKPVSEDIRRRMTKIPNDPVNYRRLGVAALFMFAMTILTWSLFPESVDPVASSSDETETVAEADTSLSDTIGVSSESQRYVLPKSSEVVYIDDQAYHNVKYLILDYEDIENEGDVMRVIKPREAEYLIPATIY